MSVEQITIEVSAEKILDPGVLEFLVLSGRIPSFATVISGGGYREPEKVEVWCELPPAGVKPGYFRKTGFSMGECEYLSPDGKSLGFSTIYHLTPDVAREAQKRVDKAAKQLNIPRKGLLHKLVRKLS